MVGCTFQEKWRFIDKYAAWIESDPTSQTRARCKLCRKSIDLSSMGESALGSHAKGMKHEAYVAASASCSLRIPDHFESPRVESAVTTTSQFSSVDSSTGPAQMASSTGTAGLVSAVRMCVVLFCWRSVLLRWKLCLR